MSNLTDARQGTSGFCLIYRDVLTHPSFLDLSRAAILCYLYIGSHTGGGVEPQLGGRVRSGPTAKRWRLSIARFVATLGISRASVLRGLGELEKASLLKRDRTGGASWFTLFDPPGVGARRLEAIPDRSRKHDKRTFLGVPDLTVRIGSDGEPIAPLSSCVSLVRSWEAFKGSPVSVETWVTLGFDEAAHEAYTEAYPARVQSRKCDNAPKSQIEDVNSVNISEVSPQMNQISDTLETTLGDLLKKKKNPSSKITDGASVVWGKNGLWSDGILISIEEWIRRITRILPRDGRTLSVFLRRKLLAIDLGEILAENGGEPSLRAVEQVSDFYEASLDEFGILRLDRNGGAAHYDTLDSLTRCALAHMAGGSVDLGDMCSATTREIDIHARGILGALDVTRD